MFFIYCVTIRIGESMKKLIKIFIFILLVTFSFRVDAKEWVEEELRVNPNSPYVKNGAFIDTNDGGFALAGETDYVGKLPNSLDDEWFVISKYDLYGKKTNQINIENDYYSDGDYYYGVLLNNGNYVIVGERYNQAIVFCINNDGNVLWGKEFEDYQFIMKIINDDEFIYMIAAERDYSNNIYKNHFLKFNYAGEEVSSFVYDGNGDFDFLKLFDDYIYILTSSADGNSSVIYKYNKDGDLLKQYSYNDNTYISNFTVKNDNIIFTRSEGYDYSNNTFTKSYVGKFDSNGNLSFSYELSPEYHLNDYIDIHNLGEGYLITRVVSDNNSVDNLYTLIEKYDESFNKLWEIKNDYSSGVVFPLANYQFVFLGCDLFDYSDMESFLYSENGKLLNSSLISISTISGRYISAVVDSKDNYYMAGYIEEYHDGRTHDSMLIRKFDKNDNYIWGKTVQADYISARKQTVTKDDNLIVLATIQDRSLTDNNWVYEIFKYDPDGNLLWSKYINYARHNDISDLVELSDGSIVVCGYYYQEYNVNTYFVSKYDINGNLIWHSTDFTSGIATLEYMNIFNNKIYILGKKTQIELDSPIVYVLDLDGNYLKSYEFNRVFKFFSEIFVLDDDDFIVTFYHYDSDLDKYLFNMIRYKNGQLLYDKKFDVLDELYSGINSIHLQDNKLILSKDVASVFVVDIDGNPIYDQTFDNYFKEFLYSYYKNDGTLRMIACETPAERYGRYPGLFEAYYKYDITSKKSDGGSFTIDKTKAKNKEIITINAKPKFGYIVEKVIVTDTKGNKNEFKDLTFEMIPDDVEIEVVFRELINPKTGFSLISIFAMVGGLLFVTIRSKKKTLTN